MRAFIAYFAAFCLIIMGSGMGLFVLLPSVVKYQTFKDAPKAEVIKFTKLKKVYDRNTEVEYDYEFKGKEYTSMQLASFPTFTQDDERFRFVQKLRASGTKPSCYVNPSDPSDAVLINDFEHFSFWMLTLGFLVAPLSLGGLFDILWSLRAEKSEQHAVDRSTLLVALAVRVGDCFGARSCV